MAVALLRASLAAWLAAATLATTPQQMLETQAAADAKVSQELQTWCTEIHVLLATRTTESNDITRLISAQKGRAEIAIDMYARQVENHKADMETHAELLNATHIQADNLKSTTEEETKTLKGILERIRAAQTSLTDHSNEATGMLKSLETMFTTQYTEAVETYKTKQEHFDKMAKTKETQLDLSKESAAAAEEHGKGEEEALALATALLKAYTTLQEHDGSMNTLVNSFCPAMAEQAEAREKLLQAALIALSASNAQAAQVMAMVATRMEDKAAHPQMALVRRATYLDHAATNETCSSRAVVALHDLRAEIASLPSCATLDNAREMLQYGNSHLEAAQNAQATSTNLLDQIWSVQGELNKTMDSIATDYATIQADGSLAAAPKAAIKQWAELAVTQRPEQDHWYSLIALAVQLIYRGAETLSTELEKNVASLTKRVAREETSCSALAMLDRTLDHVLHR